MAVVLDTKTWAQMEFGDCDFGHVKRTDRMVAFASAVAAKPDGSTPEQTEQWSDLKGAYRLVDREQVTFDATAGPHWERTKRRTRGTWLVLCDTTEVNFGATNNAKGLGPLGSGFGRGFLLHSGLMVHPETREVVGLAGQKIRYRKPAPKTESTTRRLTRDRESH